MSKLPANPPAVQLTAVGAEATERIHAIRACAMAVANTLRVQLMEQLHLLAQQFERREDFNEYAEAEFGFPPAYANELVDAWDTAKDDPSLIAFTTAEPEAALDFLNHYAKNPDADTVRRLLGMSKRNRKRELDKLLADKAEGVPAIEDGGAEPSGSGSEDSKAVKLSLAELTDRYLEYRLEVVIIMGLLKEKAAKLDKAQRDNLMTQTDQLMGCAEMLTYSLGNANTEEHFQQVRDDFTYNPPEE